MRILYYIYDVICFISCLCITILFYSHNVLEFDVSYSMFWVLNFKQFINIYIIQMYNVIDMFYISRRYRQM
jgi:hypothetical protein